MSKILALLSGKGGSGKTTLALSIASMMSNCGINVLLVDCDLCTNGATYFYENRLAEQNGTIVSFYELIFNTNNVKNEHLIRINDFMDFMPSILQITKKNTNSYTYNEKDVGILDRFKEDFVTKYDVILFDCQAGYTDILKLVLPIVDINLFVMEADAISSSAIRSLYLKIGDYLNEKKVYQVFNKATDEEYEIYSKLSGGTVFTNIETVMFDWKIRKAFSIAEIPDMENTSASYGVQIYNISKILFKEQDIQNKLHKYEVVIELNKNLEEEKSLKQKIELLKSDRPYSKNKIIRVMFAGLVGFIVTMLATMFYEMVNQRVLSNYTNTSVLLLLVLILMVIPVSGMFISVMDMSKERRNRYKEVDTYYRRLDIIEKNKQKLEEKYKVYKDEGKS